MNIYIPTRGRVQKQITWDNLPESIRRRTFLVCQPEEQDQHLAAGRQAICYPGEEGIARKRQWILENLGDQKWCMMDDDLRFYVRKTPEAWNLRYCESADLEQLFARCERLLDEYAQVGLSGRQGNNHFFPETQVTCGRVTNFHCYNPALLEGVEMRFFGTGYPEKFTMEDFHATLTILEAGLENAIITDYAWGQPTSNNEGGCAIYRNTDTQKQSAEWLAQQHPETVKVVEKQTKTSWAGVQQDGVRTDVVISWATARRRKLQHAMQPGLF